MPPPDSAELPAMVLSATDTIPAWLKMPPAPWRAELRERVQPLTVNAEALKMAPPLPDRLSDIVQLSRVSVAMLKMPPPSPLVELSAMVLSVTVIVPNWFQMPAPRP